MARSPACDASSESPRTTWSPVMRSPNRAGVTPSSPSRPASEASTACLERLCCFLVIFARAQISHDDSFGKCVSKCRRLLGSISGDGAGGTTGESSEGCCTGSTTREPFKADTGARAAFDATDLSSAWVTPSSTSCLGSTNGNTGTKFSTRSTYDVPSGAMSTGSPDAGHENEKPSSMHLRPSDKTLGASRITSARVLPFAVKGTVNSRSAET